VVNRVILAEFKLTWVPGWTTEKNAANNLNTRLSLPDTLLCSVAVGFEFFHDNF
jgi:hypothetical protein